MRKKFKIGFIGSKDTTCECMEDFISSGFKINQIITLSPKQAEKFKVAGYKNLASFAKKNKIKLYYPEKYSLKSGKDFKEIKNMNLDLLITIGWQRLIPKEILDVLKIGACGVHGSPWGLPRGRGRSPINWALIQGENKFITSLILYTPKPDEGDIIGSELLDINYCDTCEILHLKNIRAANELLKKYAPLLLQKKIKLRKQRGKISYYPQRKPEDGAIDWKNNVEEIYNFIRAQTRPFQGAFSFLGNQKITFWKVQPFSQKLELAALNGEIIKKFSNGYLLVKTGKGVLLITDYEPREAKEIKEGKVFTSVDSKKILKEITNRYPSFVKEEEKEIR